MWLDVGDLRIERRPVVDEVNTGGCRFVTQEKSRVRRVGGGSDRPAIEPHREQDSGKEGYGDYGAPNRGAGAVQHESEYNVRPSRQRQVSSGESMPGMGRMAERRFRRWPFKCASPALALTANPLSKHSPVHPFRWSLL